MRTLLLLGALALFTPSAGAQAKTPPDRIPWIKTGLPRALEKAQKKETLTLVYFWADSSKFCQTFYADTILQDETVKAVSDLVCVSADVASTGGATLLANYGVTTLPTLLLLTPDGQPEDAILGVIGPAQLKYELDRIRSGQGTVSALRKQVAAAPMDMALRLKLADKLIDVGRASERAEILESIKRDDPQAETEVCARLLLTEARDAASRAASDPADLLTWDLAPLERHVKKIRPRQIAFEGWNLIANLERERGDRKKALDAWRAAYAFATPNRMANWGTEVVNSAWEGRDDLRKKDRRFVLELAQAAVKELRAQETPETPETPENPGQPAPDEGEEEEGADLAMALECLARAQHMIGKRSKALATIDEAIALAPERGQYRDRRAELERKR